MRTFLQRFLRIASVAALLAVVQTMLEICVLASLYRGLLIAPYRFFTVQIYDACTKLYFLLASVARLPRLLDVFLGQGLVAKLGLAPQLAAANLFIAVLLAMVLAICAQPLRIRLALPARTFLLRSLVALGLIEIVTHIVIWLASVHIPIYPTAGKVLSNLLRDAVFDGVIVAIVVAVVACAVTFFLAQRGSVSVFALGIVVLFTAGLGAMSLQRSDFSRRAEVLSQHAQPGRTRHRDMRGSGGRGSDPAFASGYNVVLISIDSLRADHLGAYGYSRQTSPSIDTLAAEGALFSHCRSTTSWTLPAHMSLLTGRSLLGHGVVEDDRRLSGDVPTLAESFRNAGYATGGIVSGPYLASRYGFASGFDEYDDRTISYTTRNESYKHVTAPLLNKTAERWLEKHGDQPFFLFLHYWDVHYDYAPGTPYDRMFDPGYRGSLTGENFYFNPKVNAHMSNRDLEHIVALYDGEIRLVDDHIGSLRKTLERLGLARRTMLVVTADHGDEFFEHGNKGHHRTLYDEVLRVPLVFYVPGWPVRNRRIDAEASLIDVMPTILGLTGITPPSGLEGTDFSSMITGGEKPPERTLFAELYRKGSLNVQVAAWRQGKKIIHHFNRFLLEAYDLEADPGEQERLPNTGREARALADEMKNWLDNAWHGFERHIRTRGVEHPKLDRAATEALRSLGYIQ